MPMNQALMDAGLSEREAKVYLTLLAEGSCTASRLAKTARLHRTTVYLDLDALMRKGLASYVIKDSRRYYSAARPESLLSLIEEKRARIEQALPKLASLKRSARPLQSEVFEGKEGVRTFYQDILNNPCEVLVLGATGRALEALEFSYPQFIRKAVKAGIKERAIANPDAKEALERHPREFIEVRYFPERLSAGVTTIIYNDRLAFHSLQPDNVYVVVLRDALLVETYRQYFAFMWDALCG